MIDKDSIMLIWGPSGKIIEDFGKFLIFKTKEDAKKFIEEEKSLYFPGRKRFESYEKEFIFFVKII